MSETISINKYVELIYRIVDQSNGEVIEQVEDPLGYVQVIIHYYSIKSPKSLKANVLAMKLKFFSKLKMLLVQRLMN